jgi:hypothetical protein
LCFTQIASEAKKRSSSNRRVFRLGQLSKDCSRFSKIFLLELCNFAGFKYLPGYVVRGGLERVVEQGRAGISINCLRTKNDNERRPIALASKL